MRNQDNLQQADLFNQAQQNLKKYWGFESFRSGQDDVLKSVFEGIDTLVLFPTGGGKSLCYQVPATVFEGMTLVISPLVALMQDQVQQLQDRGISATFINSTLASHEVEQRLINARNGMYKLLYCAPERLKTPLWEAELPNLNIQLVAVDEAHCISEWGHDFRPSYRKIKTSLSSIADKTRWLALTATATPEVKEDILKNLGFSEPNIIARGFSRPNLKWWVIKSEQKKRKLLRAVKKASETGGGLIYGGTRRNCEELADLFKNQGITAEAYHAGMNAKKRKAIQQRWISGKTPLVVATNAFGMGIDKPDCRYVVHEEIPYSLEAYYQEAGRAGRDGLESFPILIYRDSDKLKAKKRLEENYPTRSELEKTYQALCDSFELALGSEMQEPEYLKLEQVKKRSGLSKAKVKASLKLLNKLDIIAMEEESAPAIQVHFTQSRELLTDYKNSIDNADKKEFIDKIERLFGHGAFAKFVKLEEKSVLNKLNVNHNSLIKALNVFKQNDRVLEFEYLQQQTLVKVLEARSSKLPLSKQDVENHRDNLFRKLEYMIGYVYTEKCREVYLRNYFGDTDAKACGHCDNCLKVTREGAVEFTNAEASDIAEILQREEKQVSELQKETKMLRKKVIAILQHYINENKVTTIPSKPGYYKWTI